MSVINENSTTVKEIEASVIIRHLEHNSTPAERQQIYEWINACGENREEYHRVVELWALRNVRIHSSKEELENAVYKFNSAVEARSRKRLRRIVAFTSSVAAALAMALITIGAVNISQRLSWQTYAADTDDDIRELYLKDGTKVYLNSSSEISFRGDFNVKKRNVRLKGEAYFEVNSDPSHPFRVMADGMSVKVLGTSFNVNAGDNIETVLEKGRVALENSRGDVIAEMMPGQRAVYDPGLESLRMEFTNTSVYTSWRLEQTVYEKISFIDIVRMIESRFGVSVSLSADMLDGSMYRLVVGKKESLQEVMETLKYIAPIDYAINGDNVTIRINKNLK